MILLSRVKSSNEVVEEVGVVLEEVWGQIHEELEDLSGTEEAESQHQDPHIQG